MTHDEIANLIQAKMTETQTPGTAVGIWHKGEKYAAGFGITHIKHPQNVNEHTLFQIGSITKTYTATAVLRLVEAGKINLDDPIQTYLPQFTVQDQSAAATATVRNVLTHTAGWVGDLFTDTGIGEDAIQKYVAKMANLVQLAPPGKHPSYCNSGFSLLGALIEKVTGEPYIRALQNLVLQPLNLSSSYFQPSDVMIHRFSVGHNLMQDGVQVATPWPIPSNAFPAGGIVCSMEDLLTYAQFHMGDGTLPNGTRILSSELMTLMHTPQVEVGDFAKTAVGLSWFIDEVGGNKRLSHGGGTNGHVSTLMIVPQQQFILAILTNCNRGAKLIQDVSKPILEAYLGTAPPEPKPIEAKADQLEELSGTYGRPFADVIVTTKDNQLALQLAMKRGFPDEDSPIPPPTPFMPAALCGPDEMMILQGPLKNATCQFIRDETGHIKWLRLGFRLHQRQS